MESNIHTAFLKAQMAMSNAVKGSKNPFFNSKYADLNAVREAVSPALFENGIYISQQIEQVDGKSFVKTILVHAESDTSISTSVEVLMKSPNDAQAQGSAITYARRYGLQAICGIGADDDDGNAASGKRNTTSSQPKSTASTAQPRPADLDLEIAIDDMRRAVDGEEIRRLWGANAAFKQHPQYKAAMNQRVAELGLGKKS
ncbi:MAG: ERF family protein [Rikenellaceae bacterium]